MITFNVDRNILSTLSWILRILREQLKRMHVIRLCKQKKVKFRTQKNVKNVHVKRRGSSGEWRKRERIEQINYFNSIGNNFRTQKRNTVCNLHLPSNEVKIVQKQFMSVARASCVSISLFVHLLFIQFNLSNGKYSLIFDEI